jgi:hypothetical protein
VPAFLLFCGFSHDWGFGLELEIAARCLCRHSLVSLLCCKYEEEPPPRIGRGNCCTGGEPLYSSETANPQEGPFLRRRGRARSASAADWRLFLLAGRNTCPFFLGRNRLFTRKLLLTSSFCSRESPYLRGTPFASSTWARPCGATRLCDFGALSQNHSGVFGEDLPEITQLHNSATKEKVDVVFLQLHQLLRRFLLSHRNLPFGGGVRGRHRGTAELDFDRESDSRLSAIPFDSLANVARWASSQITVISSVCPTARRNRVVGEIILLDGPFGVKTRKVASLLQFHRTPAFCNRSR